MRLRGPRVRIPQKIWGPQQGRGSAWDQGSPAGLGFHGDQDSSRGRGAAVHPPWRAFSSIELAKRFSSSMDDRRRRPRRRRDQALWTRGGEVAARGGGGAASAHRSANAGSGPALGRRSSSSCCCCCCCFCRRRRRRHGHHPRRRCVGRCRRRDASPSGPGAAARDGAGRVPAVTPAAPWPGLSAPSPGEGLTGPGTTPRRRRLRPTASQTREPEHNAPGAPRLGRYRAGQDRSQKAPRGAEAAGARARPAGSCSRSACGRVS